MSKKQLVGHLQNMALVLLTLSALFLLSRLPMFHSSWAQQVQTLLSSRPAAEEQPAAGAALFPSVHLVVTGAERYGRCAQLYLPSDAPQLQQVLPLFREALGSAADPAAAADKTLRNALEGQGLYLDLTVELPLAAAAAWLGEEAALDRPVRSMALTTGEEETAMLYLRDQEGGVYRCFTALPASAVEDVCALFSPNGGGFAYETNYATLAPYTVLPAETADLPDLLGESPAGYSAYNLLTALDFNAHTLSRYTETGSGAEVVEESPRSLRISPDGTVSFRSQGETSSPLYQVPCAGESPGVTEALAAAARLALALIEGTGASPVYLSGLERTETGYTVSFRYQAGGVPVLFPDEGDALTVTITGAAVTAFSYRCRSYTPQEEAAPLLPSGMAQALGSLYPGTELSVGYVDEGAGALKACWLAG
ncbi:MAG: hypothetical protein HFF65_00010 [Oscillospiraceae bacterium]|jgi:hypothetical protein|nr:hypothetical protein [Oscillospiraceae bacterium]